MQAQSTRHGKVFTGRNRSGRYDPVGAAAKQAGVLQVKVADLAQGRIPNNSVYWRARWAALALG